jgi:hypothetical protein
MTDGPLPPPEPPKPAITDDHSKKSGKGALIIVLFVVGVVVAGTISGALGDGEEQSSAEDVRYGAFDVCTDFVRDRLKAPGSASFRNYFQDDGEVRVTGSGNGPYTVVSTVDAQNSFGAELRSEFRCVVILDGDTWRLQDIQLDQ